MKWFGPETCRVLSVKVDLRVGGEYRFRVHGEGMGELEVGGVYREIKPPSRLVYSWKWSGHPALDVNEMLVTVQFVDVEGFTEVRLTHEGFSSIEHRDHHSHGWNGSFDKLERHFAAKQ